MHRYFSHSLICVQNLKDLLHICQTQNTVLHSLQTVLQLFIAAIVHKNLAIIRAHYHQISLYSHYAVYDCPMGQHHTLTTQTLCSYKHN